MSSMPEIHAIVEVVIKDSGSWVKLPRKPWPAFVRLWRSTAPDEIALIMGVLSWYGRESNQPASRVEDLLAGFPRILPGGIRVVSDNMEILPGCCSGLEHWRDWDELLRNGRRPWTGHDPSPLVELVGPEVHLWSDGGLGEKPADEKPLIFSRDDFTDAVVRVHQDLLDFLEPLRRWLMLRAPEQCDDIVQRFRTIFVDKRQNAM